MGRPEYPQPHSLEDYYRDLYPDNPALAQREIEREHRRLKRTGRGWRQDDYMNRLQERATHENNRD